MSTNPPPSDVDRFSQLLMARRSLIRIVTAEEQEALEVVEHASARLHPPVRVQTWSAVQGVGVPGEDDSAAVAHTENPAAALVHWCRSVSASNPAVCVAFDLGDHLSDPRVNRALREAAWSFRAASRMGSSPGGMKTPICTLVMIDHRGDAPPSVAQLAAEFELSLPAPGELEELIRATVRRARRESPVEVQLTKGQLGTIVQNLRGLSRRQVELIVSQTLTDARLDVHDLPHFIAGKRRELAGAGLLEFVEAPASLDDVGGLSRLKAWLRAREAAFTPDEGGLEPPRGLMLLGVQGAGKSLCAKAIATAWRRPLMRLDAGSLYDRYVGESERRLRDALHQAEAMAPVVLWIDEIEKAFASAGSTSSDGGLSRRMFGMLLTWMQERRSPVFLVATANDIEALPPELLRKGRFDEIFFVDLPPAASREAIVRIHLTKRRQDPRRFDIGAIVAACEGFSGAEIEQAVISALHEARAAGATLDTPRLVGVIRSSPPLSVTMREKIEDLRAWSRSRCMPAE